MLLILLRKEFAMPEVLTEVEPEAICIECKLPFTFDDSRSNGTRDMVLYCSPECEVGLNIEGKRRALEREVIKAAKAEIVAADEYKKRVIMANWKRSVETREARQSAVRALLDFESQQIKK